jgi:hypothetical protein
MYPVIFIADNAPELPEQLGNKEKFWLHMDERLYLFKIGRPGTGENWAEKVASELCALLGLPHADYDFALWKDKKGILSPAFHPKDGRLIMGNELLAGIHTDYPEHQNRGVKDHTLGRIHALLSQAEIRPPLDWEPPDTAIHSAFDVFIGYLLLDAWIANQDRHHQNWGLLNCQGCIHLAPTYDHAASMGQNETDETRRERLTTRDRGRHISHYVGKARSAIYERKTETKPLLTIDAFRQAAHKHPEAARIWLERLGAIRREDCQAVFEKIPPAEISPSAIEFALALLELNQKRLLDRELLP